MNIQEQELPEGWIELPISTAFRLNPPKLKKYALPANAPVSVVPMAAVDAASATITGAETQPIEKVRAGLTSFQNDDVIMAKITPCMENGKAAVARGLSSGVGFGSTEFHVFRSIGIAQPEYLLRYIRQESFRRTAQLHMSGNVGQQRVPTTFFAEESIPIPPPAEQIRIVEKVESLLARVNASRERLGKVPAILKRFRQAVLAAACSGRLTADWRESNPETETAVELLERISTKRRTNAKFRLKHDAADNPSEIPESWVWTTVETIAAVQGGIQKQPKRAPVKNRYPYLRVANVGRGKLDLNTILEIELFGNELETLRLERGDILIVEGNGSLTEIGRSAIWGGEIENCVHQNHIIRVRVFEIVPEFVNYYWNSSDGIQRVTNLAATTTGLYTLSVGKISSLPVPIPSLAEQQEIVRRVEKLFKLADAIAKRVTAGTARAEKLTQAILAKAFRGELVPTEAELARQEGRSYESAADLLKRISRNGASK